MVFCYIMLRFVGLGYVTLRYATLRYATLRCVALRYVTLCYVITDEIYLSDLSCMYYYYLLPLLFHITRSNTTYTKSLNDYKSLMAQEMVRCRTGDKPLPETLVANSPTRGCITGPQCVKDTYWVLVVDVFEETYSAPITSQSERACNAELVNIFFNVCLNKLLSIKGNYRWFETSYIHGYLMVI